MSLLTHHLIGLQCTAVPANPPRLPVAESGAVPSLPGGQSVTLSSIAQSRGPPVAQTFLQPTAVVQQVSPNIAQQYFQGKGAMIQTFNQLGVSAALHCRLGQGSYLHNLILSSSIHWWTLVLL